MLHKETVESGTLDLIHRLLQDDTFKQFNLVGGTALSLQLGHRKSVDIDLFTKSAFDKGRVAELLEANHSAKNVKVAENGIISSIDNVKVDLIYHPFPDVHPLVVEEGIRMASLEDIGAMKFNAMIADGSRFKDYIDMYVLLENRPLKAMINAYTTKYPNVDAFMARTALTFFDDIVLSTVAFMRPEIKMRDLKVRFSKAIRDQKMVFPPPGMRRNLGKGRRR